MSVPHLDTRYVNGKRSLLFGPYAGFSTNFLKNGSYLDLPLSIRPGNIIPMLAVAKDNMDLTAYLVKEVAKRHGDKVEALREYYPEAKDGDWELITAGQRVQIIKKDPQKGGILQFGTEVIAGRDGSIGALLGASPGASTAVPIMIELLQKTFPKNFKGWQGKLKDMMPGYGVKLDENPELAAELERATATSLQLESVPPATDPAGASGWLTGIRHQPFRRPSMFRLAHLSLANRALIALITVFASVFGVITMSSLKQELIPSIEFPQITVLTSMPGASPEVVDKQVSGPLETALNGVEGLESTSSTSRNGVSQITMVFTYGSNLDRARNQIDRAISNAKRTLPADVQPQAIAGSISDFPIVFLAVSSDKPLSELNADLLRLSVPRLQKIDGVRGADVTGGATQHIEILPRPAG